MRFWRAIRAGVAAGWRAWQADGADGRRERAQRQRLAEMTDAEIMRASSRWGGDACLAEAQRRGLL